MEHSWRKKLHVYRYIHQLKRVLADAEKRARFQQALSVHQDQITAFHQLLSAGRQAAVQKLQQLTTAANRREALHIIQYFNNTRPFGLPPQARMRLCRCPAERPPNRQSIQTRRSANAIGTKPDICQDPQRYPASLAL